MRLEELEDMNEGDLRRKANEAFTKTETEGIGMLDKPVLYAEARFYVDELERRKNDKVSRRDFRLELIVIALIALELVTAVVLSILGGRQQSKDVNLELKAFGDMQGVLSNLQDTSKATAATMTTLETTTENMNGALQKQLALFYDVSVNALFDGGRKVFNLSNNGRTNVSIWGIRMTDEPITLLKEGRVIPPGGAFEMSGDPTYDVLIKHFPKPAEGLLPYEVFIKNERGEEFIQHGYVGLHWQGDVGQILIQTSSIVPESWAKTKGVSVPASTKAPSSNP